MSFFAYILSLLTQQQTPPSTPPTDITTKKSVATSSVSNPDLKQTLNKHSKLDTSTNDTLSKNADHKETKSVNKKQDSTPPFYSQFNDIDNPAWRKRACGIASLAMILDFYDRKSASVNALLERGIASEAYIRGAGWSHRGLAQLAEQFNLSGRTRDFNNFTTEQIQIKLRNLLANGPFIASVHYKMVPGHPIPHLAVINKIEDNQVYYNDPAKISGGSVTSLNNFMKAWKKRAIVIRPESQSS